MLSICVVILKMQGAANHIHGHAKEKNIATAASSTASVEGSQGNEFFLSSMELVFSPSHFFKAATRQERQALVLCLLRAWQS